LTGRRPGSRPLYVALLTALLLAACTSGHSNRDTTVSAAPGAGGITGATYYLRSDGDDSQDGRSSDKAWRTLARASAAVLHPGDGLLLRGGDQFDGTLLISADDAGDAAHPVVIASSTRTPAKLTNSSGSAIYVQNTGGVRISNLIVIGQSAANKASGIAVFSDQIRKLPYDGITIEQVNVSGFADGISVGAASINSGFADVVIRDSATHGNLRNGVNIYGPRAELPAPGYANRRVLLDGVRSFDNTGDPSDLIDNTGSGIILSSTDGGVVTGSTSYGNGASANASRGPGGIWAYDANNLRFEHNLSYANRTGTGTADGNGYEFDINVTNSVMQYNLSYGNDGAGYLVCNCEDGRDGAVANNVVRYNISSSDVRRRSFYSGIMIISSGHLIPPQGLTNLAVYGNTVVMSAQAEGAPAALRMYGVVASVRILNNVFVVSGGSPFVDVAAESTAGVQLTGNAYQDLTGNPQWRWGGADFRDPAAWSNATGQEAEPGQSTAVFGDLGLPAPLALIAVTDARDLPGTSGLLPADGSPLRAGGVDLKSRGIDRGPDTFFGPGHPCPGPGIGASC
jgi:hypothetical protein